MKITAENYDKIKQDIEAYEIENNIPVVGRWGWFSLVLGINLVMKL